MRYQWKWGLAEIIEGRQKPSLYGVYISTFNSSSRRKLAYSSARV